MCAWFWSTIRKYVNPVEHLLSNGGFQGSYNLYPTHRGGRILRKQCNPTTCFPTTTFHPSSVLCASMTSHSKIYNRPSNTHNLLRCNTHTHLLPRRYPPSQERAVCKHDVSLKDLQPTFRHTQPLALQHAHTPAAQPQPSILAACYVRA